MSLQQPEKRAAVLRWVLSPLSVLLNPIEAVPRAVAETRWVLPLIVLMAFTSLAGAAVGTRLDASRVVLPKLAESGELIKASEREIAEQVEQAQRVAIVSGVAKGLFGVPLMLIFAAAAGWTWVWLLGGRTTFVGAVTAVSLAALPLTCEKAITLASALRQQRLSPQMADELVPSSVAAMVSEAAPAGSGWKAEAVKRLLGLLDFFHVWAAALLGLGLSEAGKIRRVRGVPAGILAYFLVLGALFVGIPNLVGEGAVR